MSLRPAILLRVFIPFALGYFLSYLFRTVNAVIAPDLVRDIGVDPASLGLLTSAYFLAFAAFQLPLGVLLDRYGARRVEAALLLFAAAGAFVFRPGRDTHGVDAWPRADRSWRIRLPDGGVQSLHSLVPSRTAAPGKRHSDDLRRCRSPGCDHTGRTVPAIDRLARSISDPGRSHRCCSTLCLPGCPGKDRNPLRRDST